MGLSGGVGERLGALEAAARAATAGPWMVDDDHPNMVMKPDKPGDSWDGTYIATMQEDDFGLTDPANAEHIVTWDPAAVLDLVAGLRAAVALHQPIELASETDCSECGVPGERDVEWPCPTLVAIGAALGVEVGA